MKTNYGDEPNEVEMLKQEKVCQFARIGGLITTSILTTIASSFLTRSGVIHLFSKAVSALENQHI